MRVLAAAFPPKHGKFRQIDPKFSRAGAAELWLPAILSIRSDLGRVGDGGLACRAGWLNHSVVQGIRGPMPFRLEIGRAEAFT
jgi:hypothetical protein